MQDLKHTLERLADEAHGQSLDFANWRGTIETSAEVDTRGYVRKAHIRDALFWRGRMDGYRTDRHRKGSDKNADHVARWFPIVKPKPSERN